MKKFLGNNIFKIIASVTVSVFFLGHTVDAAVSKYIVGAENLAHRLHADDVQAGVRHDVGIMDDIKDSGTNTNGEAEYDDLSDNNDSNGDDGFGLLQLSNWFGTNENWKDFLPFMKDKKGTYVGIGFGGQNLSFLANSDFEKAVIVDNNPFVTRGFFPLRNILILMARNRAEYLAFISGVYFTEQQYADMTDWPLEKMAQRIIAELRLLWDDPELGRWNQEQVWKQIVQNFPDVANDPYVKAVWDYYSPKQFRVKKMLPAALQGESWLCDEDRFYRIKELIENDAIQTVTADWFQNAVDVLEEAGIVPQDISCLYLSNIFDAATSNGIRREQLQTLVKEKLQGFGIGRESVLYAKFEKPAFLFNDNKIIENDGIFDVQSLVAA